MGSTEQRSLQSILQAIIDQGNLTVTEVNTSVATGTNSLEVVKNLKLQELVGATATHVITLEAKAQELIQLINEQGLRVRINQAGHGFTFNAVQFDKALNKYVKATVDTSADAMAIRVNDNFFDLVANGSYDLPEGVVDSAGNALEVDEYYFLDPVQAGGFTPIKPTKIYQPLFLVAMYKDKKVVYIDVDTAIDLEPRILTDEIDALGLATTDQVVLAEPTIAALQKAKKYKVGDVVQVQGYYEKGDGAGHLRQKKAAGYTGADAVIGADGSIWGIVHSGELKSSWLGFRDGDNISDLINKIQNNDVIVECELISTSTVVVNSKVIFNNHKIIVNSNVNVMELTKNSYVENVNFEINIPNYSKSLIYADEKIDVGFGMENKTFVDGMFVNDYKKQDGSGYFTGSVLTLECIQKEIGKATAIVGQSFKNFKAKYLQYGIHLKVRALEDWGSFINSNFFTNLDFVCGVNLYLDGGYGKLAEISANEFKEINFQGNNTGRMIDMRSAHGNLFKGTLWDGVHYYVYENREAINIIDTDGKVWCDRNIFDLQGVSREMFRVDGKLNVWYDKLGYYNKVLEDAVHIDFNRKNVSLPINVSPFKSMLGHLDNIMINADRKFKVTSNNIQGSNVEVVTVPTKIFRTEFNTSESVLIKEKLEITIEDPYLIITPNLAGLATYEKANLRIDVWYGDGSSKFIGEIDGTYCCYDIEGSSHAIKIKYTITPKSPNTNITIKNLFASDKAKHSDNVLWSDRNFTSYSDRTYMNSGKNIFQDNSTNNLLLFRIENKSIAIYDYSRSIEEQRSEVVAKQLDTPYHATNMQKLGILDDYHNYLTELHEYEKQQNTQSDTGVMNLNVIQPPIIPKKVEEYAKEYNLI